MLTGMWIQEFLWKHFLFAFDFSSMLLFSSGIFCHSNFTWFLCPKSLFTWKIKQSSKHTKAAWSRVIHASLSVHTQLMYHRDEICKASVSHGCCVDYSQLNQTDSSLKRKFRLCSYTLLHGRTAFHCNYSISLYKISSFSLTLLLVTLFHPTQLIYFLVQHTVLWDQTMQSLNKVVSANYIY